MSKYILLVMLFSTCLIAACDKSDNTKLNAEKSLELSKKCSDQSVIAFKQLGYKIGTLDGYENHYNLKLNKCFILINSYESNYFSKSLIDAFELKSYAWFSQGIKKGGEYFHCELTVPGESNKICKTINEYDKFVFTYMNE